MDTKCAIVDELRPDTVSRINQLLVDDNHCVETFKVAKIFELQDVPSNVKIVINENKRPLGEHSRRYITPMNDEISILMPNDNVSNRDIVLHYRDGSLQRISELYRSYDPLLFLHGTEDWHINLKPQNGKKFTTLVYYRYHIIVRQNVSILNVFSNNFWLMHTAN